MPGNGGAGNVASGVSVGDNLAVMHADPGLCADCRFARRILSSRGVEYFRCGLAGRRPGFEKYPRIPVVRCKGYESRDAKIDGGKRW